MKRCIEDHLVPGFGLVPAGSLWDDDSPYVVDVYRFVDVDEAPAPVKVKKAPVRKFGTKGVAGGDSGMD